jgi:sugar O-acyltransferase (sialic acid O-acetyltransferase NeuD family)
MINAPNYPKADKIMQDQSINSVESHPKMIFGLFGSSGFAREVMPLISKNVSDIALGAIKPTRDIYFVEKNPTSKSVNRYPLLSEKEFFEIECSQRFFNIAISDSKKRERIANECISKGAEPMSIKSMNSIIYDSNEIGLGLILCANTMITSNVKIGKFFHSNIYSYVAHDCVIGDYVTFAPNVHCNGNVHIHDHAYIGTNAVIKQGTSSKPLVIGEGAVIGMGAVVTKDVQPFTTVIGNPAKVYRKN